MTSKINVLLAMIFAFVIFTVVLANEIRKKDELIVKYEEYVQVSQRLIDQMEYNSCLKDEIIKYYEYAEVPSELQCAEPMAIW